MLEIRGSMTIWECEPIKVVTLFRPHSNAAPHAEPRNRCIFHRGAVIQTTWNTDFSEAPASKFLH